VTQPPRSVFALHGFAQTPSQWLEIWPHAATPWISGHGPNPTFVPDFTAEVGRLAELALGLRPPRVLLGYSQGARLGLGMLADFPDLFERAVLVGVQPGLETEGERAVRVEWEQEVAHKLEVQGLDTFWAYWEALPALARMRMDPAAPSELARRTQLDARGLAWAMRTLGLGAMPNFWPLLPAISSQVELVVGELDTKFLALAERARPTFLDGRLHIIPGAGHNPLFDAPQAMASLVRRILSP
jgi:2-succinyl-6-hydroxy-2,4-cyclohexadiene-1-carboxylate synthase